MSFLVNASAGEGLQTSLIINAVSYYLAHPTMANFIHDKSQECAKSELDIFTIPPTQTSVEKGSLIPYQPIASITDGGPVEFYIPGAGDEYIDLAQTQLYIRAKITNADGSNLAADAPVGPVNLFLHSLFSQVDVSLNERLITASTPTYPYRAMIETLLSYGHDAKHSQLSSALYFKDTAGNMDVVNPTIADDADPNVGLKSRYEFTQRSRVVDMIGRIHSDIFFQNKYLLNGVNMKIKLIRSKNEFCLVSSEQVPDYRVHILEATLFVRRMKLSPSIQLGHSRALERGNAKYPVRRVLCKMMSVPAGNMTLTQDHVFLGSLPNRIVIGCVDNTAFNGSFTRNPFNFEHYNVTSVAIHVDGEQIPSKPLRPTFQGPSRNYVRAYHTLFSGTNKMFEDQGNEISRSDYGNGYTLYAFDLTPDLTCGGHFNLQKQGNLRLEINFGQALARTINVIVYAEFENIIEIDRARNIVFDYTS